MSIFRGEDVGASMICEKNNLNSPELSHVRREITCQKCSAEFDLSDKVVLWSVIGVSRTHPAQGLKLLGQNPYPLPWTPEVTPYTPEKARKYELSVWLYLGISYLKVLMVFKVFKFYKPSSDLVSILHPGFRIFEWATSGSFLKILHKFWLQAKIVQTRMVRAYK